MQKSPSCKYTKRPCATKVNTRKLLVAYAQKKLLLQLQQRQTLSGKMQANSQCNQRQMHYQWQMQKNLLLQPEANARKLLEINVQKLTVQLEANTRQLLAINAQKTLISTRGKCMQTPSGKCTKISYCNQRQMHANARKLLEANA